MNQISSLVTGGTTITAATLVPMLQWLLAGCPKPIPDSVPYLVAALIVTGAHALGNWWTNRQAAKTDRASAISEPVVGPTTTTQS
ncbi:Uncharacterised protein [Burkholderia pseudomallei]|uniref:hypothetical protein n=1 Tax=Burkholderia pseudomallei TaxID=28450 RepID=UPI000977AD6A|nr:hypothetical protein [Burkholderia pseudomallei]OMS46581.1 hypothetical protein AQ740_17930 [Burkholderia pseudomallei]CAJ3066200.1 Uncharacterised protein [Burkholderia pseudomallei]CAJ3074645.1 Uncharacterised protein [Burkholderia pseudomallei]CAJ3702200.1 Uncharacterised protein [Burkholderia pseudomallei]CAJ3730165.1 Uncharacterised protein [Burkholderia pseudomallei]